ncbi:MAG: TonB family protein [Siphonobacter sp.]
MLSYLRNKEEAKDAVMHIFEDLNLKTNQQIIAWQRVVMAASVMGISILSYFILLKSTDFTHSPVMSKSKNQLESIVPDSATVSIKPLQTTPKTEKLAADGTSPAPEVAMKKEVLTLAATSFKRTLLHDRLKTPVLDKAPYVSLRAARVISKDTLRKVVDEHDQPIPGVQILVKDKGQTTQTNAEGTFNLPDLQNGDVLLLNGIGYLPKQVTVGDTNSLVIRLNSNTSALAEVVTVGYGKTVEKQAARPDTENYQQYLLDHTIKPAQAKGISGIVAVRFRVEKNGSLTHFKIKQGLGYGCDEEAVRVIQEGPKWQPALKGKKPVREWAEVSVLF